MNSKRPTLFGVGLFLVANGYLYRNLCHFGVSFPISLRCLDF